MRILVTGSAGLIGSGVAARLAQDHQVIGLDLVPGSQVSIIGDCFDVAEWRHLVGRVDAIVHVAALHVPHVGQRSDAEFRHTNVEATSRLLDFAVEANASHFVLTSTTSIYGAALEPNEKAVWVDEQLAPQPRDIYDDTKLKAEALVASAANAMTVTSLRMSRCFSEPSEVMAWYRLHRGVDRRDVAEAHALALVRTGRPATYVVSGPVPFHRDDCDQLFADAASVIERRCPGLLKQAAEKGWHAPTSIGRVYDSGVAVRELGYSPRFGIEACFADNWDPPPLS